MTTRKLDDEQLAHIVGAGCGNPKHAIYIERDHLCKRGNADPPGGHDTPDAAGGTEETANKDFGE